MNYPSVCLIVLNWNACKLLEETLLSLKKVSYPNLKIIVVDNGSVDESVKMVKEKFSGLNLICNEVNLGFGEGNNVGISYALEQNADYVLLLNNDVEVDSEFVTELVNVAESSAEAGMVAPKIYFFEPKDKIWYAGAKVNFFTGVCAHIGLRKIEKGQFEEVKETDYICGCGMLIKSEVLRKIGMFDPIYSPAYAEDVDLSQRAKISGYKLLYSPKAKIWHKISSSSGGDINPAKTALRIKHNFIFFKKFAKPYHWLTIIPYIGFATLFFLLKQIFNGNFGIFASVFKGFFNALKSLSSRK